MVPALFLLDHGESLVMVLLLFVSQALKSGPRRFCAQVNLGKLRRTQANLEESYTSVKFSLSSILHSNSAATESNSICIIKVFPSVSMREYSSCFMQSPNLTGAFRPGKR